MNHQQMQSLLAPADHSAEALIARLEDRTDRTLIWGYTVDRESFHVYLKDGALIRIVYRDAQDLEGWNILRAPDAKQCIPNKRIYPEASDFEFCAILRQLGFELPFTNFNDQRAPKRFYGAVPPIDKFPV